MAHPPHPLASLDQLDQTPSSRDGVAWEIERELRVVGCMHVQELGVLLALPQSTIATAQVLLHRFYYVSSLASFTVMDIALASLYLASKLCETIIRLRDLLNVHLLLEARNREVIARRRREQQRQQAGRVGRSERVRMSTSADVDDEEASSRMALEGDSVEIEDNSKGGDAESSAARPSLGHKVAASIADPKTPTTTSDLPTPAALALEASDFSFQPPAFHSRVFYDLKDALVVAEVQILKRLGFNMQVDLPYSHMVNYCKILDLVGKQGVVQRCWSILNDALQTPVYVTYPPSTVACFSILLATRLMRIPLPDSWWTLFDAEYDDLWDCCGTVMRLWDEWGTRDQRDELDIRKTSLHDALAKEERWNRAWKLASSKRAVRAFVAEEYGTAEMQIELPA